MTLSRTIAETVAKYGIKAEDLISVLQKYNYLSMLPTILSALRQIKKKEGERDTLKIESPFPVGNDALKAIQRIVGEEAKHQEISLNENLLAGFKARFKGKLYDASAERLMKEFIHYTN